MHLGRADHLFGPQTLLIGFGTLKLTKGSGLPGVTEPTFEPGSAIELLRQEGVK